METSQEHQSANSSSATNVRDIVVNGVHAYPIPTNAIAAMNDLSRKKLFEVVRSHSAPLLYARLLSLASNAEVEPSQTLALDDAVSQLGREGVREMLLQMPTMRSYDTSTIGGRAFSQQQLALSSCHIICAKLLTTLDPRCHQKTLLCTQFSYLGPLLLSYYAPQLFQKSEKRARQRDITYYQSLKETLGMDPLTLSPVVTAAVGIPPWYQSMLEAICGTAPAENLDKNEQAIVFVVRLSLALGTLVNDGHNPDTLARKLKQIAERFSQDEKYLHSLLVDLPPRLAEHNSLATPTLKVPTAFCEYLKCESTEEPKGRPNSSAVYAHYLEQIADAVAAATPLEDILALTMETLAFGMHFDRVLVLIEDPVEHSLAVVAAVGETGPDCAADIRLPLLQSKDKINAACAAYLDGKLALDSAPIFEDAGACAALPIGLGERSIGVLYADFLTDTSLLLGDSLIEELSGILSALTQQLDSSIGNSPLFAPASIGKKMR